MNRPMAASRAAKLHPDQIAVARHCAHRNPRE
jgi:hypothetical protein